MKKHNFTLMVSAITVLALLLLGLTACNIEPRMAKDTELDAAQKLYDKFVEDGSIIEVDGDYGKEIEFADGEAEAAFEDAYVNAGLPLAISEANSSPDPGRASITLSGHIERKWYLLFQKYIGKSTASGYTPYKIRAEIDLEGAGTYSKTATNTKSVTVEKNLYGYAPRATDGLHECWYDFGKGYLRVWTYMSQ